MKVINLDELELKCIEYGLGCKLFTKEDLNKDNLFTIKLKGEYYNKECVLWFKGLYHPRSSGENSKIVFTVLTWEDLYYKVWDFFR